MAILSLLSIIGTSFGFTLVFGYGALKLFPHIGLMDKPEKYGLTRAKIPYPGGVAIFLAVIVAVFSYISLNAMIGAVLLGATLLAVTSFWDDRRGLSPYLRLCVQAVAAILLVLGGIGISSISNPFGAPIVLDSLNIPLTFGQITFTFTVFADILTVIWVITMVNAFNWIDGVPGMASATTVIASFVLLLLSSRAGFHYVDQTLAITLSAIIFGASSAFLIFDFPAPRMLMGDTGSMLFGFLLAVTALISGGKIATTVLVLGFPILDFVWVILRRIIKGQSPFKGDLWHFHHRLIKAGYSERMIVIFFASAAALFGAMALLLHTEGKIIALISVFAVMVTFVTLLYSRGR